MDKQSWKQVRRASQLLCFFIFLALFRLTDYTGADTIPYAVNIFFRMDPLVGACVTLAARTFIGLLLPCLIIVALTILLGRFFCAWICPLGTTIDMAGHFIRLRQKPRSSFNLRFLKYTVLVLVLISSLFTVQFLGFVDPFAILVRGMVFSFDPIFNFLVTGFFDWIYLSGPAWLSQLTEPGYDFLKSFILPHKHSFFYLSFLSFLLLTGIFVLELSGKRFWCRNLCPLGALLALISKVSFLKRIPIKTCKGCNLCEQDCPMDVFDIKGRFMPEECNLCMDCLAFCPNKITGFRFGLPGKPKAVDISRRQLMTAGFAGICIPVLSQTSVLSKVANNDLIRPPGALDELDFLATCIRCGECMKVCITNGLQPLSLEKGLAGMFTPILMPRLGYCEFNCTLCSQVCPTQAIQRLSIKEKHAFKMGIAYIDKNRCLPFAEKKSCIVCEEHCPVHDKAIKFDEVRQVIQGQEIRILKQPRVFIERCIGCGICEKVCPIPGEAAIRVIGKTSQKNKFGGSGY
jgi:MauM/NapG family ferredoxin protein